MVYLAGRRNTERTMKAQTFMAFTNQPSAELIVNGKSCGVAEVDSLCVATWHGIELQPGENIITVISGKGKNRISDTYKCRLR